MTLPAATELHRIHRAVYKAEQFNPTAEGDARFSPIRDAEGAIVPTIYAAQTFACAAYEIILRCPDTPPVDPKTGLPTFQIVFPADFRAYGHSIVRTMPTWRNPGSSAACTPRTSEPMASEFIQNKEVEPHEMLSQAARPACTGLGLQPVHEIDDIKEPSQ